MKITLVLFVCLGMNTLWAAPGDDFVTTWQTDNPGTSNSTSITVPMIGGPYDVDWDNDLVFDEFGLTGPVTHDFGVAGTYTIRIQGNYDSIQFANEGDNEKIISLEQWGTNRWTSMNAAFEGCFWMHVPASDVPDFSAVTNMNAMFRFTNMANPDTSNWNTSAVTNMNAMFESASAHPDTSGWDTSAVTDMGSMFLWSPAEPDTSDWDTSAVTNMSAMFLEAASANPDTSNWDTSAVTDTSWMFAYAQAANPDTSNWDTSAVTNMSLMFYWASSANPDTSGWDTSSVTEMSAIFYAATSANPNTSNWDTSAVTDMSGMFSQATSANPHTGDWNTSAVTNMTSMFWGATSANPDVSGWNTSSVTSMAKMFSGATVANPVTGEWDTSSVTRMWDMFRDAVSANPDTSGWDTSAVTRMDGMFWNASSANPDTSNWNTSAVTNMNAMFNGAPSAHPDTSGWDTSAVTDMGLMFASGSANPNTSGWDTSVVTTMAGMFAGATSANPDVSGWDTSAVTDMSFMFVGASSANPDVSSWDASAVTTAEEIFEDSGLSTGNYETLLVNWSAQTLQLSVPFSAGNTTYCSDEAAAARDVMTSVYEWNITDGGRLCDVIFVDGFEPVTWRQLGVDIDGEAAKDWSGESVSLSFDGRRVAIGAGGNDDNGNGAGHVRVYQWSGSAWQQLGADIDGESVEDASGARVSLSADGNRVAIGAPGNDDNGNDAGQVRVYQWSGSAWQQLGADIDGEAAEDHSGGSVSLSADGSRVAIGALNNNGSGVYAGHVRVYQWSDAAWQQLGVDIDGEAAYDQSGWNVSLSSDGGRLAIGAHLNNGNGDAAGHVRVYQWSGAAWQQLGADIDGEAAEDYSGVGVSLSADGSRVAIGASHNDGTGVNAGHVRVYQWSGVSWQQLGADIDGEAAYDGAGGVVSLSANGSRVAISGRWSDGNGDSAGHVRVYQWSGVAWQQLGADIDGEAAEDNSGWGMDLSADGSRVAIGAPFNDGNGDGAGHVRVLELGAN